MGSALPVGSLAFVAPQEEYQVGDIITFKIPNSKELLTHRIVSVGDGDSFPTEVESIGSSVAAPPWGASHAKSAQLQIGASKKYRTQGDANNVVDDWELADNDIVGKVIFHIPYLGYLLRLPQTLIGKVFLQYL